jgi:hypothetical protein
MNMTKYLQFTVDLGLGEPLGFGPYRFDSSGDMNHWISMFQNTLFPLLQDWERHTGHSWLDAVPVYDRNKRANHVTAVAPPDSTEIVRNRKFILRTSQRASA